MKKMNGAILSYILQQRAKMPSELDLIRQLERLEALIPHNKMEDLLPAFHYTVEQLSNYLKGQNNNVKRSYYVDLFERCFKMLTTSQKTKTKTRKLATQKAIMNEIMAKIQDCKLGMSNHIKQHKKNKKEAEKPAQQSSPFHQIIKQISRYYDEHNLDSCHISIGKLQQLLAKYPDLAVFNTSAISDKINSIQKQYQKMIDFYKHFDDQENWVFDRQENDVRMQYRVYEAEKTIAVRINAIIEMEMLPFLAIACEIDLQKEYVPFVQVSQFDIEIDRNIRAGYSRTSVPILADRECYFYAVGYDRTQNQTCNSIFIFTESYEDNLELRQKHRLKLDKDLQSSNKTQEEKVLLKLHYFCLQYIPLSPNRAKIRLVTKADFKMSYLPLFILQKAARIFTSDYFTSIVEKAKKYKDSQWEKRVQKNPKMYNFFQEKIDQFFKKKL